MTAMPCLRFVACVSLLLLAGCASSPGAPPANGADVRIERVDREFDLDAGIARVAIDNPWGEINVRGRDEREVGLHAVIQRLPPRFAKAEIRSRRDGDTLRIEIVLPETAGDATAPGRVDVAVYVPGDMPLSLATRSGRIAAKRRAGAIEARTDSGDIEASSLARLDIKTRSGSIRAIAIGRRWQGGSEISSDSGHIIALVPTFGDVALDARTGGALTTGFGLSVHALPGGGHEAHARYGAGTSPLRVFSQSGEIVLEQLILLGDDTELPEDDD